MGRPFVPLLGKKLHVYTLGRSISPFPFKPFIFPPGLETNAYVNHVVDALGEAYTLGDGSKSILQRALASCYREGNAAPTVSNVLKALEEMPSKLQGGGDRAGC